MHTFGRIGDFVPLGSHMEMPSSAICSTKSTSSLRPLLRPKTTASSHTPPLNLSAMLKQEQADAMHAGVTLGLPPMLPLAAETMPPPRIRKGTKVFSRGTIAMLPSSWQPLDLGETVGEGEVLRVDEAEEGHEGDEVDEAFEADQADEAGEGDEAKRATTTGETMDVVNECDFTKLHLSGRRAGVSILGRAIALMRKDGVFLENDIVEYFDTCEDENQGPAVSSSSKLEDVETSSKGGSEEDWVVVNSREVLDAPTNLRPPLTRLSAVFDWGKLFEVGSIWW